MKLDIFKYQFLMLIFMICTFVGCKKDQNPDRVPFVVVDFQLNLSLPSYQELQIIGNWIYITGGSRGIVIYRKSQDEFMAFDRHCTYLVPEGCRIYVDQTNIQAADNDCCESVFSLLDGLPIEGLAFVNLTQYQTSYNYNTQTLSIFN